MAEQSTTERLESAAEDTTMDTPATASATADTPATAEAESADKPTRGRPRKSTARKTRQVALTLTVTGSEDGADWRAEVVHGTTRVVPELAVSAAAVVAAAKDLHPDIAEAIDGILETAREQHRSRVEQLQAELAAAQAALASLDGETG
ncbi:DUF6319 family protein [Fodinicola acaciae]|uniref:DUF6319 family protein n=1 Tax=Fodinicola acaciae TaxID=2681555 RepID=UPI0013D2C089|nr:DUF6319 family protein [Fodinicola acaciae]